MQLTNVENLLVKLINLYSPSGNELSICQYVYQLLQDLNFDLVRKQNVDNGGFNIIAEKGSPKIALQAHLDVVSPQIKARIKGNKIYGRGSCDTKSCVAAMIFAAKKALDKGLGGFALIFTVGEEKDFRGVKKLIEVEKELPFAIVGEPTNLEVINGHYGIATLTLEAKGRAAHTSRPKQGINAIDKLLLELNKIKSFQPKNRSLMSLVYIEGGKADNVVPEQAEARYSFRISPDDKTNYLQALKSLTSNDIKIKKGMELKPVLTQIPENLTFLGKGKIVKYATELSFLKKGIVIGPGNINYAHSKNEFVKKDELLRAINIYLKILEKNN